MKTIRDIQIHVCLLVLFVTMIERANTEPFRPDLPKDDTGNWAFQKHNISFHNEERGFVRLNKLNFGPFGANQVSLTITCDACLDILQQSVQFYFDNLNNPPSNPILLDARRIIRSVENELEKSNTITFELLPENGIHDVYITLPENVIFNITSVQFFSAEPTRGQWYYLIVHWNGKALTGCNQGEYACTHPLHGGKSQRVRFEKDSSSGGFTIVSGFDDKVWSVKDGSSDDHTILVPQKFNYLPYQIWFIEEYDGAYRFHPKHNLTKCLDLTKGHNHNGAKLVSHFCNNTPAQTFNIILAC